MGFVLHSFTLWPKLQYCLKDIGAPVFCCQQPQEFRGFQGETHVGAALIFLGGWWWDKGQNGARNRPYIKTPSDGEIRAKKRYQKLTIVIICCNINCCYYLLLLLVVVTCCYWLLLLPVVILLAVILLAVMLLAAILIVVILLAVILLVVITCCYYLLLLLVVVTCLGSQICYGSFGRVAVPPPFQKPTS